jgi:hypothetical protein
MLQAAPFGLKNAQKGLNIRGGGLLVGGLRGVASYVVLRLKLLNVTHGCAMFRQLSAV